VYFLFGKIMYHNKKEAKHKAATAIRAIIEAARELTAAERVLLEGKDSGNKPRSKGEIND